MLNRFLGATMTFAFLSVSEIITFAGSFLIFAFFSLCAFLFTFQFVPETKYKSLEEMTKYFEQITNQGMIE